MTSERTLFTNVTITTKQEVSVNTFINFHKFLILIAKSLKNHTQCSKC